MGNVGASCFYYPNPEQQNANTRLDLFQSTSSSSSSMMMMKLLFALLLASCLLAVAHAGATTANNVVVGTTATKVVEPVIVSKTAVIASPSPAAVLAEATIFNQQPVAFQVQVSAGGALRPFSYLW